jgi:hypothetical protein
LYDRDAYFDNEPTTNSNVSNFDNEKTDMDETTENKTFSGETVTETISFLANEETQLNNDGKIKNFTE